MTDRSLIKDAAEHARRSNPLADTDRLAAIRAEFERTTHPDWRDTTDFGWLLARVDRLTADLAQAHVDINSNAGLYFEARDHAKQAEAERDSRAAQFQADIDAALADLACSTRDLEDTRAIVAGWEDAAAMRDRLRSRLGGMADAWERDLPETVRTAVVVETVRLALETDHA